MAPKTKKALMSIICIATALLCFVIGIIFGSYIALFPHRSEHIDTTALIPSSKSVTNSFLPAENAYFPMDNAPLRHKRLLFTAAVYGMKQFLYLQRTLDHVRDICNAGWNVSIILHMANEIEYDHPRYRELHDRAYCHASGQYIPMELKKYGKIGFGLNKQHRISTLEHLNEFDYFVYVEEDMSFSLSHLNAFIEGESRLKKNYPKTWTRYIIGFLRYEESVKAGETTRVSWEYRPHQMDVVDMGSVLGHVLVTHNMNQALSVFSREQLIDLQTRCRYLTDIGQNQFYTELRWAMDQQWKFLAVGVSEWASSFQHVLQCGVRRIIPIDHLQTYMIHHSVNKAQGRRPRSELLTMTDWMDTIANISKHPVTLNQAYQRVYEQFNMHMMRKIRYEERAIATWEVEYETPITN